MTTTATTTLPAGTWTSTRPQHRRLHRPPHDGRQGPRPVHRVHRRHRHRRGPAAVPCHAIVQMASIDTDDEGRDNHLRTNDFFDIEKHPTMTFRRRASSRLGGDYKLHGDLTIRGVTQPVTFDLEVGGVGQGPVGQHQGRLHAPPRRSTARTSASS